MRVFAHRVALPGYVVDLVAALRRPRELGAVDVGLYSSSDETSVAELLVPIPNRDARYLPWTGQVEVRGTIGAGHAVALTHGSHTVYANGPATVPQLWRRRYRNRPWRWPRSGVWDAEVGSEVDG